MYKLLTLSLLLTSFFMITSCGSDGDSSVRQEARESLRDIPPGSVAPPTAAPSTGGTAVQTGGVQHYICPNNCEGSGGASQGTCPTCGATYTHNQAYHNQPATNPTTTIPGSSPANPAAPAATSPATNAAGVYHYTCPDGHSGGAGSAGSCATCGKALVHNQAYHSN